MKLPITPAPAWPEKKLRLVVSLICGPLNLLIFLVGFFSTAGGDGLTLAAALGMVPVTWGGLRFFVRRTSPPLTDFFHPLHAIIFLAAAFLLGLGGFTGLTQGLTALGLRPSPPVFWSMLFAMTVLIGYVFLGFYQQLGEARSKRPGG